MFRILRGANTKLVLYTYDSFTLDVDKNEKEIIEKITQLFKKYKLQTKFSYGETYDFR